MALMTRIRTRSLCTGQPRNVADLVRLPTRRIFQKPAGGVGAAVKRYPSAAKRACMLFPKDGGLQPATEKLSGSDAGGCGAPVRWMLEG